MSLVTGQTTQNVTFESYDRGSCSCGSCSAFTNQASCDSTGGIIDWQYDTRSCCGSLCTRQPKCSKPSPGACPVVNGTNGSVSWVSAADQLNDLTQGRAINCTYPISAFQTADGINAWLNVFGRTQEFNTVLMPAFCSQPSQEKRCPIDPLTDEPMNECSRLISTDAEGSLCRQWQSTNPGLADAAAQNYCSTFTQSPDCLCYNRATVDPIYRAVEGEISNPTLDACWYRPCQNSPPYLIPPDQRIQPGSCPSTICQQVINFIDSPNSNININVANEVISCSSGGGNSNQISAWIIAGAVAFIIIVIIIALLINRR